MNADLVSLPLSARGLLRELAEVIDDDGVLQTSLREGADARSIGDELARLLCAFRGEYARVRRDVAALLERGLLALEGSRLLICDEDLRDVPVVQAPSPDAYPTKGSAKRMRNLRARRKAAQSDALPASHVTLGDVTGDASSDAGDASQAPLSLKINKIDLTEEREGKRHRDAASDGPRRRDRVTLDTPFDETARRIAEKVVLPNADVVWLKFVGYWADRPLPMEWQNLWQKWVGDELIRNRQRPSVSKATGSKQSVDFDAPWMREAMGSSS